MSSTGRVFGHRRWYNPGEIPPGVDRSVKKVISRLKDKDFIETAKAGGKDWDVYQTLSSSQMWFLALRLNDQEIAEIVISDSMVGLKEALVEANQ